MEPTIFGATIIAFVLAVGLVGAVTRGPNAPGHLRIVGTVFLLAITAFCVFGFLASFQLASAMAARMIYLAIGSASLIGATCLATLPATSRLSCTESI